MIHYIWKDMAETLQYLPCGMAAGAVCAVFLVGINAVRRRRTDRPPFAVVRLSCLALYAAIILCITFLSRELGSRVKTMDLRLFSTWGETGRAHAFVIENILLFIPYGYLLSWNLSGRRGWFFVTAMGALSSLGIESMQLVTGRGYFQIDDILMNTLGMLAGTLLYSALCGLMGRIRRKRQEKKHADVRGGRMGRGYADRDPEHGPVRGK